MQHISTWRTWRRAMAEALYGDHGFYLGASVPSRHFRTAAHTGGSWAAAIASLATQVDESLSAPSDFAVVDVGAGGGELLAALAMLAPDHWSLVGVDVADRPADLPSRVSWRRQFPDGVRGLVVAVELLDVIPLDVVELAPDGLRVVEVDHDGVERTGDLADFEDREWLASWWPLRAPGARAEVGRPRDEMWREITGRLESGVAVAVDYAADPNRDVTGTLTGYQDGRQRPPVPDASMDLTAHVLFTSLRQDGDALLTQREALRRLGITAPTPDYADAPDAYLEALARTSEVAELLDPAGLGSFIWLLHTAGMPPLLAG